MKAIYTSTPPFIGKIDNFLPCLWVDLSMLWVKCSCRVQENKKMGLVFSLFVGSSYESTHLGMDHNFGLSVTLTYLTFKSAHSIAELSVLKPKSL